LRRAIEADIRDGIASIKSVEGIHGYFEGDTRSQTSG
jgi:hypothetical protein